MQYAIVGCSAAGISAVEAIRTKDKKAGITVFSDEERPLYSRCLISYLLGGTIDEEKIWYRPDSFFKDNRVDAVLGTRAEGITLDKKEIYFKKAGQAERLKFDRLLIATGSSAKLGDIPGTDKKGVFPLRTIQHAAGVQRMLGKVKNAAVLGGGLIGLRSAYALNNRGKKVTVFVRSPYILSQIIDEGPARIMQAHIEKRGIRIVTGRSAREITGHDSVSGVILDDGSEYDCELVIIGKGVSPNIGIARDAGIETRGGIVTDARMMTSVKDIFAAGDAAESCDIAMEEGSINAIWPAACEQGRVAGLNMLGEEKHYDGSLAMNSIEFFGLPVISIGITRPKKDIYSEIVRKDVSRNIYKKIVLRGSVIVGAVFLKAIDTIGIVGTLIKNKVDITGLKDIILEDYFDYGKIVGLIKDSKKGFKEREFRETTMTL